MLASLGTSITASHGVRNKSLAFPALAAARVREATGAAVTLHVAGMGGFQPSSIERCMRSHLPATGLPMLILLEYAVMPDLVGFERMLRRLLRLPASPAVVAVNIPSFANGPTPLPPQTAEGIGARNGSLRRAEQFDDVAAHYGVPTVSLWRALREQMLGNSSAYQLREVFLESVHISPLGHRLVAELFAHLYSRAARAGADAACAAGPSLDPLPPPLLRDNRHWETSTPREADCVLGESARPWIVDGGDWELRDEGSALKPKPGWVASSSGGAALHACHPQRNSSREGGVWSVAFLSSYTAPMGSAVAKCSGGCRCAPRVLRGWNPPRANGQPWGGSTVQTEHIRFHAERARHPQPNATRPSTRRDAMGGRCSCLLSLSRLPPAEGIAPYHSKLLPRQPPRGTDEGASEAASRAPRSGARDAARGPAPGTKFKLVGLAFTEEPRAKAVVFRSDLGALARRRRL